MNPFVNMVLFRILDNSKKSDFIKILLKEKLVRGHCRRIALLYRYLPINKKLLSAPRVSFDSTNSRVFSIQHNIRKSYKTYITL